MGRAVLIAITLFTLMLQSSIVIGSSGQVLKVVDGDTFLMDVAGVRGQETIEVNLRCSDAPIISAPFGAESRQYLETLLKGAEIHFKIQTYCGSEACVEVLAYIPDPLNPKINYINTQMIAAGMARNDSCRGVFNTAETQAKSGKKGIWSTSKKIVFTEAVKAATTKTSSKPTTLSLTPKAARALIEVDRAERTVTLKSKSMSLSKAINAIDTVSTLPVSLYLIEEQFVAVSLEKVAWYTALQHLVDKADLKQVNMNGKIDLYDQLFYYKHIAPYLKLSDNDGVYINARSGDKSPVVDDGVTRYVFINDFENTAVEARQKVDDQSGFVQVHQGSEPAPVSDYGRFEVSGDKEQPATVATTAPETVKPLPTDLPALKPYSGQKSVVEQKEEAIAVSVKAPVKEAAEPVATAVVENTDPQETVTKTTVFEQEQAAKPAEPAKSRPAETKPADEVSDPEQVLNIALSMTELVVLLIVVVVVVFGSIFLSRSAAKRASKAEKSIDPATLNKKAAAVDATPEPEVDKAYEKEVFEDIEHGYSKENEKAVDDIFEDGDDQPVEPPTEDRVEAPVEEEFAAEEEAAVESESVEEVDQEEDTAEADTVDVAADEAAEPEEPPASVEPVEDDAPAEVTDTSDTAEETKVETNRPVLKEAKKTKSDEGNYAVTLDDYDRLMNPPKREPRTDCLFEMTCTFGDQTATGIGLDISSGGIFIDSKDNFAIGKVIDLTFKLNEEDEESIRCRGAVTWVNERPDPIKPNYPNGFGVHFIDVDAVTAQAIEVFLHGDSAEHSDDTEDDL